MKKLLIVVDYQKDFVDGALGFPGAEALDGPIAERIAAYRAAGNDGSYGCGHTRLRVMVNRARAM